MNGLYLVLTITLAAVTADVEKRQLPTCTNAFTLTNNPCFAGNLVYYYPVPNDNTKFIQCDSSGAAYVVQCPVGRIYDAGTTTCKVPTVITNPIVTAAPAGPIGLNSLCTNQAFTTGQLYFSYPGDKTRYYRCNGINQIAVVSCPTNLVWDQTRVSCVLSFGTGTAVNPTQAPTLQNPCTLQQLAAKHYYFSHPDPTKFIQCDLTGQMYVLTCPQGLAWRQSVEVCASSATNPVVG